MIEHNLPALQVVIPLVAAPLCVVIRNARAVYGMTFVVAWLTFACAVALFTRVADSGDIVYAMGGWVAPWGIEYRVDQLSGFVLVLVAGMGAAVATWAPRGLAAEVAPSKRHLFWALYLLCLSGLLGIAITGDLFNVFVFLEISALSSYGLIALGGRRKALPAAFRYLIMGTIGATFILIGIGLMYMMTGTLNMADMATRLPVDGHRTVLVAFAFLTVGISLKAALFPLHAWLPDAYAYAPSTVSALLAATATKVSVYILLRFFLSVFGADFAFGGMGVGQILMVLAVVGMFVASAAAIFQGNLKRMLAYSSVAQIGYMVLGISLASTAGLTGGIVHLFNHGLIKGGMFMATGCILLRAGSVERDELAGIGKTMPWTMMAWTLGGLGLIGVPGTAGFVSKWYLLQAALEQGHVWLAVLLLLSSLLAVAYVWRVVEQAYFKKPAGIGVGAREAPLSMLLPTLVVIGLTLFFGFWTDFPAGAAGAAAESLLGGALMGGTS